jgi:small GTP-binding protein
VKQKKICLLGAFSVGKTSLIKRFVSSIFDEKYLTTVGVKIDKKLLRVGDQDVQLMIWDLAGEDDFYKLNTSYLRGTSGYILVIDPTRPVTCDVALGVHQKAQEFLGPVPVVVALNKSDLKSAWALDDQQQAALAQAFPLILETSAMTDTGVEELFATLATMMLEPGR